MKLRRGCGCPIFILGLANLVYVVAGLAALITNIDKPLGALLILVMGLANTALCVIMALAAFKGEVIAGATTGLDEGEDTDYAEGNAEGNPEE